jgi:hypothetical protein
MGTVMTEAEARKIFDAKLALCDVLGLDLKAECADAGVPVEMIEKFLNADKGLANAMTHLIVNPSALPLGGSDLGDPQPTDPGFGFLCLSQKMTGLPMMVWTMEKGDSAKAPYIRVQTNHSAAPQVRSAVDVSVEEGPKLVAGTGITDPDFAAAAEFISRNMRLLLDYWNGVATSSGLLKGISRSR